MSLVIRRLGSSNMEVTNSKWLRVIAYDILGGNVDTGRILRSTRADWERYIPLMAFRLAVAGSRWDLLKRDTH